MKTIVLFAALLWASVASKSIAADVAVTPVVLHAFQQTFATAADVQWSVVDHLYKAEFSMEGEKRAAFFSADDGTLIASSRYINLTQLPRVLQSSLKTYIATCTLLELFEVQTDDCIDYYATVQTQGETVVLKAAAKNWKVYKKG